MRMWIGRALRSALGESDTSLDGFPRCMVFRLALTRSWIHFCPSPPTPSERLLHPFQLERRKATPLTRAAHGVRLNEHLEAEGPLVFEQACRMELEGIVSKRKTS